MIKQRFISAIAAITLSLGVTAPAIAATAEVEGGLWNYGTNNESVWSYYKHTERTHKSTARGESTYYSGCTKPKLEARASGPRARSNNESYYGFC
ncbi:lactococcin 972 family bacteriocin [Dermatophilus congolensis]|uniref:lactococcin 972 family bacteriocin n=1 Tax=Dermatophilus congolensis TaxID=1863 RepID=UPI001AAF404F|nr:lactococcin 972 family bacteriocin [Dermatophilus congolensis]MBO3150906.1 lactococcin 972 family bacteriocin [Dermatophilus congolensis]MBO3162087.1 lactococcin 972 family bacteriocin [Dermatophilus congolensis]MBO3162189.1 lactococcin 972 family bacteriocin [Dermatophilus congolensis]MBO3175745.1 lactococcin 972 family bacteriocin [Dermatophilus congolensis]